MKLVATSNQNKVKTIRTHHWLQPGLAAFVGMMLITGSAYAANVQVQDRSGTTSENADTNSVDMTTTEMSDNLDPSSTGSADSAENDANNATKTSENNASIEGTVEGSRTEIRIESSVRVDGSGSSSASQSPSIKINGQEHEIPSNGRIREDIRTENSRTRIRGNVDSSGTSIRINTGESVELDGE